MGGKNLCFQNTQTLLPWMTCIYSKGSHRQMMEVTKGKYSFRTFLLFPVFYFSHLAFLILLIDSMELGCEYQMPQPWTPLVLQKGKSVAVHWRDKQSYASSPQFVHLNPRFSIYRLSRLRSPCPSSRVDTRWRADAVKTVVFIFW